ncbi:hypothetical protein V1517DRAFT_319526 [Lipomyces orientalis]|uniref:Uncharacterized protein n=1 Tax=Lipomyces orientalis TaxID=1233043 RepID=A0ACC3TRB1_9ASCO
MESTVRDNGLPLSARILSGVNPRNFNSPIVSLNSSLSEGIIDVINCTSYNATADLRTQYAEELIRIETTMNIASHSLPISIVELSAYLSISRDIMALASNNRSIVLNGNRLQRRWNVACHGNHGARLASCRQALRTINTNAYYPTNNDRRVDWSCLGCAIVANNNRHGNARVTGGGVFFKAQPIIDTCWNGRYMNTLRSGVVQADNLYTKVCVCNSRNINSC